MATVVPTRTTDLTANMQKYYDKVLLDVLRKSMQYYDVTTKKRVPLNSGKVIYFIRYTAFGANTTALSEGVVPDSVKMSSTNVSATLSSWGGYVTIPDLLSRTAIDNTLKSATAELGYRAGLTLDTLIRNECTLHGTVQPPATATEMSTTNDLSVSKILSGLVATNTLSSGVIKKAVRTLKAADVPPHSRGDYVAIIHPYVAYDIMGETSTGGFLDINKYTTAVPLYSGEIGKMYGVRFIESSNVRSHTSTTDSYFSASMSGSAVTCYRNQVFGADAVGAVQLAGMGKPRTLVKGFGSAGSSDPLDQLQTVGYKIEGFVAKTLQDTRFINLVTSATA